jgi:hypothetical protein
MRNEKKRKVSDSSRGKAQLQPSPKDATREEQLRFKDDGGGYHVDQKSERSSGKDGHHQGTGKNQSKHSDTGRA